MNHIKAMKQALEALESYHGYMEPLTTVFGGPRVPAEQSTTGKVEKAITTLRTAIEQAQTAQGQEPVGWAWRAFDPDDGHFGRWGTWNISDYKPPRQQSRWFQVVPLPDTTPPAAPVQELEKAAAMALDAIAASGDFLFNWHDCEPNNEREMDGYSEVLALNEKAFNALRKCLLTPAAQRQWVGLTGQQKKLISRISIDVFDAIHRTEAKLRERNGG